MCFTPKPSNVLQRRKPTNPPAPVTKHVLSARHAGSRSTSDLSDARGHLSTSATRFSACDTDRRKSKTRDQERSLTHYQPCLVALIEPRRVFFCRLSPLAWCLPSCAHVHRSAPFEAFCVFFFWLVGICRCSGMFARGACDYSVLRGMAVSIWTTWISLFLLLGLNSHRPHRTVFPFTFSFLSFRSDDGRAEYRSVCGSIAGFSHGRPGDPG
jgi:hypothetical protein